MVYRLQKWTTIKKTTKTYLVWSGVMYGVIKFVWDDLAHGGMWWWCGVSRWWSLRPDSDLRETRVTLRWYTILRLAKCTRRARVKWCTVTAGGERKTVDVRGLARRTTVANGRTAFTACACAVTAGGGLCRRASYAGSIQNSWATCCVWAYAAAARFGSVIKVRRWYGRFT